MFLRQRAINLHYSAPSSTPHRRQTSPARPASPRRTASSGSSYPPSPPSNRTQSTPIVARLGLGTVYGLFLPVRFVLRILIGFWYMLGRHQMAAVSPYIRLLTDSLDASHYSARTIVPNSILSILPRLLVPPSSQGRILPNSTRSKPFVQSLREDYTPSPVDLDQLPDFYRGPYKEFLRGIRADPKLGVVILCCAEHEDDEAFKREVLLNEELGRVFREKNIAVWAGDVRDREAYQGETRNICFAKPCRSTPFILRSAPQSRPDLADYHVPLSYLLLTPPACDRFDNIRLGLQRPTHHLDHHRGLACDHDVVALDLALARFDPDPSKSTFSRSCQTGEEGSRRVS